MALFRRNKNDEYYEASRKLNDNSLDKTSSDRIIFEKLQNDDTRAVELIEEMKNGNPIVVNFEDLDIMEANKMLAFLSGACYAIEGTAVMINEVTYLFARKIDFLDGSLKDFLEQI